MSGRLAGKVWMSALPRKLKPLAAALADIARDDGSNIRPGLRYTAWLLSDEDDAEPETRTIQRGLKELRRLGVLSLVAHEHGGRGYATEYHLHEEKLPQRRPWREAKAAREKGDNLSPIDQERVTTEPEKGDNRDQERVTAEAKKGDTQTPPTVISSLPSSTPANDPAPSGANVGGLSPKEQLVLEWQKAGRMPPAHSINEARENDQIAADLRRRGLLQGVPA